MRFTPTKLKDVILVEPDVREDERGFFLEFYHRQKFVQAGLDVIFVQDNHSRSLQGTLRGFYGQLRGPQGNLIGATEGEIFDVSVDARLDSPPFGQWVGVILSKENFRILYIPPGFLHGFCVTSPAAEGVYN